MKKKNLLILKIVVPLILAFISAVVLVEPMSSPKTYKKTIASLEEKKETVTALATAATTVSVGISMIHDDWAAPIAEELAELSSSFLIILSVIYMEKYMLPIIGHVTFFWLIPIACILYAVNQGLRKNVFTSIIRKLLITGVVLMCVIPASEKVSTMMQATRAEVIESAIELSQKQVEETEDDSGWLSGIISDIKDSVTEVMEWAQNVLSNFTEAVAIMIVTSCVIPIVVLLFLIWFFQYILNLNMHVPERRKSMFARKVVRRIQTRKEECDCNE